MKDLARLVSSMMMAFATTTSSSKPLPIVIVSGAGGKTGGALLQKLADDTSYRTIGWVRTEASKTAVLAKLPETFPADDIAIVDVTNEEAVKSFIHGLLTCTVSTKDGEVDDEDQEGGRQPPARIRALCIATSATPVPTGVQTETGRPIFGFPNGQPILVDWVGSRNQIDACPDGTHVVLCSTMGGTNPNHPLNNIGRDSNTSSEDKSCGLIVQYKRKAEMYLMNTKRLQYTIVHPSGLIDEAGGQREIILGVDDVLKGSIPRQDVAAIMYEAVKHPEVFASRSFDAVSNAEGSPTTDLTALMKALETNCDYSLGAISV